MLLVAIFSHYFSLLLCHSLYFASLPPSFLALFIHFVSPSSSNSFFFFAFRCSSSRLNPWRFVPKLLLPVSCLLSGPLLLSTSFTFSPFLLVSFSHPLCAVVFLRDVCRSRAKTKLPHLPCFTHLLPPPLSSSLGAHHGCTLVPPPFVIIRILLFGVVPLYERRCVDNNLSRSPPRLQTPSCHIL